MKLSGFRERGFRGCDGLILRRYGSGCPATLRYRLKGFGRTGLQGILGSAVADLGFRAQCCIVSSFTTGGIIMAMPELLPLLLLLLQTLLTV